MGFRRVKSQRTQKRGRLTRPRSFARCLARGKGGPGAFGRSVVGVVWPNVNRRRRVDAHTPRQSDLAEECLRGLLAAEALRRQRRAGGSAAFEVLTDEFHLAKAVAPCAQATSCSATDAQPRRFRAPLECLHAAEKSHRGCAMPVMLAKRKPETSGTYLFPSISGSPSPPTPKLILCGATIFSKVMSIMKPPRPTLGLISIPRELGPPPSLELRSASRLGLGRTRDGLAAHHQLGLARCAHR